MTATPLLHVGYPKTATTWFQRTFYPRVRNIRYLPKHQVKDLLLDVHDFDFDAVAARRAFRTADGEAFVLCDEEFCGSFNYGGWNGWSCKGLAARLHATFPEAHVALLVRNQLDMIASSYLEYLRGGGTYAPRDYLFPYRHLRGNFGRRHRIPAFSFAYFKYDKLIDHYIALFGRERVHVFLYEQFKEDTDGFLEGFAARFGLDVDVRDLPSDVRRGGYRTRVLPLARAINRFSRLNVVDKTYLVDLRFLTHKRRKSVLEHLNGLPFAGNKPSPRELLGAETADYVAQYYAETNARLRDRLGLPVEDYGYICGDSVPRAVTAGG